MDKRKVEGRWVFASGPVTGIPDWNRDAFGRACMALLDAGAENVHDPTIMAPIGNDAPMPHEWYMRRTLSELTSLREDGEPYYQAIAMLPGWESSEGATLELAVAEAIGLEVIML